MSGPSSVVTGGVMVSAVPRASSVVTGGVMMSAATLAPLVTWALDGFPQPVPDVVPYLLSAAIITLAHALYNVVQVRLAAQVLAGQAVQVEQKP